MRCHSLRRSAAIAALLSACTPFTKFSPQSGVDCAERKPGCDFEVISSRPARDYQTIGVIDLEAFGARYLPNDEAAFRRAIAADVCRTGGDAVIAGINGDRRYVMATVVKWVADGQKERVCPVLPADAGTDAGAKGKTDAGAADAEPSAPREAGPPDAAGPGPDGQAPSAALRASASEAGVTC